MTLSAARFGAHGRVRSLQKRALAVVVVGVCIGGCSSKEQNPTAKSVAVPSTAELPPPPSPCAADGLWKPCTLLYRLTRSGVGPREAESDTTRVPFLSPPGVNYKVGKNGLLIAFYFADSIKAKAEWSKLDTLRLVPPGDTVTHWPGEPSTIRTGNLVVAFFGTTGEQIERVSLAIRAGLPAPAKP